MISVILLAGGVGRRMDSPIPKQFLPLQGKPIALHSFEILRTYGEVIVVCPQSEQHLFPKAKFAEPGARRQDSVENGLKLATGELICIHDAARPFITKELVDRVVDTATVCGAAAAGIPLKFTVKECTDTGKVIQTPSRACFWEVQTPQVIKRELLIEAFEKCNEDVTDDVSLIEALGHPVQMVPGAEENIKITTPLDLTLCKSIASQ